MKKVLGIKQNFLGIDKKFSGYDNSKIVILSAPLEKTVSYGKGTAAGPSEILKASHYVEFFDEETNRELCFELGICTLPEMSLSKYSAEAGIDKIYEEVHSHLKRNKFVVTLGGEHSLSQGPIRAHLNKFEGLSVLQVDAHSDLRLEYEGSKYSHASVMARVSEITKNVVQVGIRAQCIEEAEFIKKHKINTFYMRDIRINKFGHDWQSKVVSKLKKNVYITFDVDGFDPSLLPATGTPEPGGLFWDETMNLLRKVGEKKNIVGFDVVELAPSKNHPASSFIAAKLVYKLLNYAFMASKKY